MSVFDHAKNIIEYLARGIEFAAALIIAIAAVEATIAMGKPDHRSFKQQFNGCILAAVR